jgi:hypothetical protein
MYILTQLNTTNALTWQIIRFTFATAIVDAETHNEEEEGADRAVVPSTLAMDCNHRDRQSPPISPLRRESLLPTTSPLTHS